MKFPLDHIQSQYLFGKTLIFDADKKDLCYAESRSIAGQIIAALGLQHDMAAKAPVPVNKAEPDLGSTPAGDITFRQWLIGLELPAVTALPKEGKQGTPKDIQYAIARRTRQIVDELLRQLAEEK